MWEVLLALLNSLALSKMQFNAPEIDPIFLLRGLYIQIQFDIAP